jgi:hypothetical protein
MREAEAPTTKGAQRLTESERSQLQDLVNEEASKGAVFEQKGLPEGVSYRRPKQAPSQQEYERNRRREDIEAGLVSESGYYLDEPLRTTLPEPTPTPERVRAGTTVVETGTGKAIEKPIPLSKLQKSRLRAALARGASEQTIINILRLEAPENPMARTRAVIQKALEETGTGERRGIISGSALEKWADERLAGLQRLGIKPEPVGPDILAAAAIKGAALIEKGIVKASEWAADMVKQFGEGIRPFLDDLLIQSYRLKARSASDPISSLKEQLDSPTSNKSNQATSIPFGLEIKSVEQLDALKSLFDGYKKEAATFRAQFETLAKTDSAAADKAFNRATLERQKASLIRETVETATDTGSHVEGEGGAVPTNYGTRGLNWKEKPEAAEWLRKNGSSLEIKLPDELTVKETPTAPSQALAKPEGPKTLPPDTKQIPPNSSFIQVVDYDGNTTGFVVFPHDGTIEGIRKAAKEATKYANQNFAWKDEFYNTNSRRGATGPTGQLQWVISPNLLHIAESSTPLAQYILGDVKAFAKDRAKRAVEAKKQGDAEAANKAIMEQVNELEKYAAEAEAAAKSLAEEYRDALEKQKAGEDVKSIDDRFSKWSDYLNHLNRHTSGQIEAAAKYSREAAKWRGQLVKGATVTKETPVEKPVESTTKSPTAESDIITKLNDLKFKTDTGLGPELHALRPDILKRVGKQAWNDAIDVAITAVKAGRAIGKAIDEAVAYLKSKFPDLEEQPVIDALNQKLSPKKEAAPATQAAPPEPTQMITEKAAKAMESKVKLPVQKDVEKLRSQLDLFNNEIGDALTQGGQFLPKELRPKVAKGKPAEKKTVTNKEINQYFVNKLVTIRREFNRIRTQLERQADPESMQYFKVLQERFELAFKQVQDLRRASHEALYFWNEIKAEYQQIAEAAGKMPEVKRQIPVIDQIVKDFRDQNFKQAGKHLVDYLRMNLFTLGSWTLDFGTNAIVAATRLPAFAAMDAINLATGKPAYRMATALRALQLSSKNLIPFTERFRLPEQIETELGTTAGSEFAGRGKEVMIDFSEIIRNNPTLQNKLKNADLVLGAPIRLKRAVDTFFGRLGATAELYNSAYVEGRSKGLKGDQLKTFVEEYVNNPPESAISQAVKVGKEFKFNRDLSKWEESVANSMGVKLFAETFPRWTFQFVRWAGEMIGADPSFYKQVVTGKATPESVVNYLTKAATGWGAIYMFNQLLYDNVDANSMEYVTEEGDRTRLSGRTPLPELFFVNAVIRGDYDKAKAALAHLSVPGARLLGGEPAGIISPLIDTIRESIRGRYTAQRTASELENIANNAIPGKSVLGMIRSLFDPTIREGFGAPIPGVASLLPQKTSVTTGEPLAPKQRIPGTGVEIPTVGGTPFPGAVRVLNDIEETLLNHGYGLTRPRRTSIIDLPAEDVSKELRREYEQRVGQNVKRILGEGIADPEFNKAPFDVRRELLGEWLALAREMAKYELADKYDKSPEPVESVPLNIQRLPERLKRERAIDFQED